MSAFGHFIVLPGVWVETDSFLADWLSSLTSVLFFNVCKLLACEKKLNEQLQPNYLKLSQWNDVTVVRPMPHSFLGCCIVVVETLSCLVKELPPLVIISLFTARNLMKSNLKNRKSIKLNTCTCFNWMTPSVFMFQFLSSLISCYK